jgi:hypothetical protein
MADMTGQVARGIRGIGLAICERLMKPRRQGVGRVLLEPGDRPAVRGQIRRSWGPGCSA